MHFKCVRCARKHSFPAARTGAGGRVPCRCGATLVIEAPGATGLRFSSPDLAEADITTLGYRITVEARARFFDGPHAALRAGIGLSSGDAAAPDPASAARPALLGAAFAAALDPRLWLRPFVFAFAALGAGGLLGVLWSGSPLVQLLCLLLVPPGLALALSAGSSHAAVVLHQILVGGSRLNEPASTKRSGISRSGASYALKAALVADLCLMLAAMIAKLDDISGAADFAAALGAPIQTALGAVTLAVVAASLGLGLAHAAEAARGVDLAAAQVAGNVRRSLAGGAGLIRRPFGAGLGASFVCLLALVGLATVLETASHDLTATFGAHRASPESIVIGRAAARAVAVGLAVGVTSAFVGIAGLLAGYALGAAAPRERTRPPEVFTGTLKSMQAVLDATAGAEKTLPPDSVPPPLDDD